MVNIYITPKAGEDLEEIFEYTADQWGITQAETYQDELYHAMQLIAMNNRIGKIYPFGQIEYRKFHITRHLIFYRMDESNCIIVRILHDSMDVEREMK